MWAYKTRLHFTLREWQAIPWRIFSSIVIKDLRFKRAVWQTKGIVGENTARVGRPVEMATSITQAVDAGGGNGDGERLVDSDTDWSR